MYSYHNLFAEFLPISSWVPWVPAKAKIGCLLVFIVLLKCSMMPKLLFLYRQGDIFGQKSWYIFEICCSIRGKILTDPLPCLYRFSWSTSHFFSPLDRAYIQFGKNPRCRAICLSKLQFVRSI